MRAADFTSLLVDDSDEFRLSLRGMLAARFPFMPIAEARDIGSASKQAQVHRPSLAFVDIRLPDGNGFDFARELRRTTPNTAICIVTSHDLPEYRVAARECGAEHFFTKGQASRSDLIAVVESVLATRRRVLIIHRDEATRRRLRRGLVAQWSSMVTVESVDAREGIEQALALHPDLVLLDVTILRDSRFDPCHAIKAMDPRAMIVAMGGPDTPDERQAALGAGADQYFGGASSIDIEIDLIANAFEVIPGGGAGDLYRARP